MENYINYLESMYSSKTFKRKLQYIKYNFLKYFDKKVKSVLEIGPGLGEFIFFAKNKSITNISIIDNDKSIIEYCKKNYHITESFLIKNNLNEVSKSLKKYDLIFMNQILEHIPKKQQIETLKILYNNLNEGGKIIVNVPNAGNFLTMTEIYADITHTSAFTDNSLKEIAMQLTNKKDDIIIKGYKIPPYTILNIVRIVFQKIIHTFQLFLYLSHGGSFSKILTPNISLIIKKNSN